MPQGVCGSRGLRVSQPVGQKKGQIRAQAFKGAKVVAVFNFAPRIAERNGQFCFDIFQGPAGRPRLDAPVYTLAGFREPLI